MDWNGTTDESRQILQRVVALLLALADLADSASRRSPAVRCLVLWLLRPAEAAVWAYVARLTQQPAPTTLRLSDDSAVEAMRLALSFRTLAAILAALPDEMFAQWLEDASWQPALNEFDLHVTALFSLPAAHQFQRYDSS